jgi:hypothetical protein
MMRKNNHISTFLVLVLMSAVGLLAFLVTGARASAQDEPKDTSGEVTPPPGEQPDAGQGSEGEKKKATPVETVEEEETQVDDGGVVVTTLPEQAPSVQPSPAPTPPATEETITVQPQIEPSKPEAGKEEGGKEGKAKEGAAIQLDAQLPTAPPPVRFYQINGIIELHTNLVSDDYSANDAYMQYYLRANFDVTKNNRLSLRMDMAQEFIADPGETGFWFGDMRFYYTRKFKIPATGDYVIPGMVYGYLTAPTSRQSIARSIITKPTIVFALAPSVGPVTFIGRGYLQYVFASYAESKNEDPNPQLNAGYDLQIVYETPLKWLALFAGWSYTWTKKYRTREGEQEPWGAEYYFEIGPNFVVPMPKKGPSLDITLAYAQGANVLEDGVYRTYFVKRDQSELYLSLNLNY